MDLSSVPEIGSFAEKIREAGIPNAEALAVWEDLPALAERADIGVERLESFRDAARAAVERVLAASGVEGPEQLALADVDALADRTGLERAYLERYQRRAQDAVGKVVLAESAPVARVEVGGQTHHAVPLVTAGFGDDEAAVLSRAGGDAVLLRPRVQVVSALIGGSTHRGLALYKERRRGNGDVEEVRVRVSEIRDVPEKKEEPEEKKAAGKGIGRLFSRKK